jgi:arginine-tRNA-protein transferase
MRRNLKQNQDVRVALQEVSISRQHLDLYERFHQDMALRKGWSEKIGDAFDYYQTFVDGHQEFAYEMLYSKGERLLGVALVDMLPEALSAVYCYYDPDERHRGLGVFSVLQHVELARRQGIPHVYLGFWVEGNPSMRYKARYQPHEILAGRPDLFQEPDWRPIPRGADDEIRRVE